MASFRYAGSQIAVHWTAALLIVFLLATGTFVLAEMPNAAPKVGNLRIHMVLGILAAVLTLARIALGARLPAAPKAHRSALARAGHVALNIILLLLAASGALLAVQSGALGAAFAGGALPADFMAFALRKVHGLLSRLAMALIALHVVAALYHQWFLRDKLLSRMGLGKGRA